MAAGVVGDLVGIHANPASVKESKLLPSDSLIGVEVELENMIGIFRKGHRLKFWNITEDGSLRNNGAEFVFKQPLGGADIIKACMELEKFIRDNDYHPDLTDRTSVHVHLDVRDLSPSQFQRLVILYTIFERVLFKFAGEERFNNIFALPLEGAQGSMTDICQVFKCNGDFRFHVDNTHKYASFNFKSLNRYGSLEFRHHKGEWKSGRLIKWIGIIQSLKNAAINDVELLDIHKKISFDGPMNYLKTVFGKYSRYLGYDEVESDIMEGVRLSQDIVHFDKLNSEVAEQSSKDGDLFSKYCEFNKINSIKQFNVGQVAQIYGVSLSAAESALRNGMDNEQIEEMYHLRLEANPDFELVE